METKPEIDNRTYVVYKVKHPSCHISQIDIMCLSFCIIMIMLLVMSNSVKLINNIKYVVIFTVVYTIMYSFIFRFV